MNKLAAWTPFFTSRSRMLGRAGADQERVKILPIENEELVRISVQLENAISETVISFTTTGQGGKFADIQLECEQENGSDSEYSAELWAALTHLSRLESSEECQADRVLALRPRAPRSRQKASAIQTSIVPAQDPAWLTRLELVRPLTSERTSNSPSYSIPRKVHYVLRTRLSMRHKGIVIEVRQRSANAAGWSAPKTLKLTPEIVRLLLNEEDRLLCGMLLGSTPVQESPDGTSIVESPTASAQRGNSIFRLPDGAAQDTLRKMIATGRCFKENEESWDSRMQTLQWIQGAPYTLCLHAFEPIPKEAEETISQEDEFQDILEKEMALINDAPTKEVEKSEATPQLPLNISLEIRRNGQRTPAARPDLIVGGNEGIVLMGSAVYPFEDRDAYRWVSTFRQNGEEPLVIEPAEIPLFLQRLYTLPELPDLDFPEDLAREEAQLDPTGIIEIHSPQTPKAKALLTNHSKNQLVAQASFAYGAQRVSPSYAARHISLDKAGDQDKIAQMVRRKIQREQSMISELVNAGFRPAPGTENSEYWILSTNRLGAAAQRLLELGWQVYADQKSVKTSGPPSISISSGEDWFELRGEAKYVQEDGTAIAVNLPELLEASRKGLPMIQLDDGSVGLLPEAWLEERGLLAEMGDVEDDFLRFEATQVAMLNSMLSDDDLSNTDVVFENARLALQSFRGIHPIEPHENFQGTLRPYQRLSLGWMQFLRDLRLGGVLADDMGLGKTVQVLAMMQMRHHAADKKTRRPQLIVAPRSVVFNWADEAKQFTPELRVAIYTGADRAEFLKNGTEDFDLLITSYGLLRRDIDTLSDIGFDYCVLDEAQVIKNPQSHTAKAARRLKSTNRLALTGTPIENHLGDLWSIFEFINPGMLGSEANFARTLRHTGTQESVTTIENNEHAESDTPAAALRQQAKEHFSRMAKALRPFILRRTKVEVLDDLPQKTEQIIRCEMSDTQQRVYDQMRDHYRKSLQSQLEQGGNGKQNPLMVLEALLRLRQAACHPALIAGQHAGIPSVKLDTLVERIQEIQAEGSKALVFSQFTSFLQLIRTRLEQAGTPCCYLDGQTRNRRDIVAQFQEDPDLPVFLISLKAGGVGLNLTAAEYVFLMDPWWNPAVEAQAIDRAHRIGQKKSVFAYRMVCEGTVEQRILDLQQRKRNLAEELIGSQGQSLLQNLSKDDIESLLS